MSKANVQLMTMRPPAPQPAAQRLQARRRQARRRQARLPQARHQQPLRRRDCRQAPRSPRAVRIGLVRSKLARIHQMTSIAVAKLCQAKMDWPKIDLCSFVWHQYAQDICAPVDPSTDATM